MTDHPNVVACARTKLVGHCVAYLHVFCPTRTSPKASTLKSWITAYVLDERTQITVHDQINYYLISSLGKHQLGVRGG